MWNAYDDISGPINCRTTGSIELKITYCNDPGPPEIAKEEYKGDYEAFHTKGLCQQGIKTSYEIYFYTGLSYSWTPTGIMIDHLYFVIFWQSK